MPSNNEQIFGRRIPVSGGFSPTGGGKPVSGGFNPTGVGKPSSGGWSGEGGHIPVSGMGGPFAGLGWGPTDWEMEEQKKMLAKRQAMEQKQQTQSSMAGFANLRHSIMQEFGLNESDAEDVMQEVFSDMISGREEGEGDGSTE